MTRDDEYYKGLLLLSGKGLKHSPFWHFSTKHSSSSSLQATTNVRICYWIVLPEIAVRFPAYLLFMSIIQQRRQWLSLLALAFLRISFQSIEKV